MSTLVQDAIDLVRHAPPPLWPSFHPETTLLLIFDGTTTWLSGHTPTEPGWQLEQAVWAWPGLHPQLTANTVVTLEDGSTAAAVLLPDSGIRDAHHLAALLIHEAFHVWQQAHPSPAWDAHELDALAYPRTDVAILHARAEETACLARAMTTDDWAIHARHALGWRHRRFSLLDARHVTLERRLETTEGLAEFVETTFLQTLPPLEAEQAVHLGVRAWAYHGGAALAHLLTKTGQDWHGRVLEGVPLDTLLDGQLGAGTLGPETIALTHAAQTAAHAVTIDLQQREATFHAQFGVRLQYRSGHPLAVRGFDPMNVHVLRPGVTLHGRYLDLRGDGVRLRSVGIPVLTEGPQPLEVHAFTVVLPSAPELRDGIWVLAAPSFQVEWPAAHSERTSQGWLVHL